MVCVSDSLQLKEEVDLHREERGEIMMGFSIGGWGWHDDGYYYGEGWHDYDDDYDREG